MFQKHCCYPRHGHQCGCYPKHHCYPKQHCYSKQHCYKHKPCIHPTKTRCIDKYYYHEIPHCCPVHTRYNNHHIYKHKYYPVYTCDKKDYYYNCNKGSCCHY